MEKVAFEHKPTEELLKTREHYIDNPDYDNIVSSVERVKLRIALCKFYTVRYHRLSQSAFLEIVQKVPPSSGEECEDIRKLLEEKTRQREKDSLAFLYAFAPRVTKKCREIAGEVFWERCSVTKRNEIFGRIFDNNPMYLLYRLHQGESDVVAFTEL